MESFQFYPTPYSFNALALFLIGLAGLFYLLRIKEKTPPVYWMILVLTGFTVGMASWLAVGIVFWGGALTLFTDACAVVSTAGVIAFTYHYPRKIDSLEARLVVGLAGLAAVAALLASMLHILRYVLNTGAISWSLPALLNPLMSVATLVVVIRRAMSEQPGFSLSAFWRPASRPVRLLRNFSVAMMIGMVQGIVTVLDSLAIFIPVVLPLLINLSFSLMFVMIVYAVFDLTDEQPRLVVRLVGLSLVVVLGIAGIVGMFVFGLANRWVKEQARVDLSLLRWNLADGTLDVLPESVDYVIARTDSGENEQAAREHLIRAAAGMDTAALLSSSSADTASAWNYFIDLTDLCLGNGSFPNPQYRYGVHPPGSYPEYASCLVKIGGVNYEIGFSLDRMAREIRAESDWVWGLILASIFLILVVFPRFFQANLIHPLERLQAGVRQVEGGNLDTQVPLSYQDEIGFLTAAFNRLTASLKVELSQRQRAESELRQLNLTLEQRVADRTRELETLYDVSTAASQARDSSALLTTLLERSLAALKSSHGLILLLEEPPASDSLRLVASQGLSADWLQGLSATPLNFALFSEALHQRTPLLIPDLQAEARAPGFMHQVGPLTLLLAPLLAEGQVLGLMGLAREAQRGFDLDEVALLVSIVGQVGAAVYTDRLRQLAQMTRVLEERQRLARDLHDSVTQSLYGLATLAEAGKMRLESGDVPSSAHLLTRIGQTARQVIREMRLFLHQLRPPALEQVGLLGALELRLAAVEGRSDVRASLQADESLHFTPKVEAALYHIAQEALNNALKHSAASVVMVRLARLGAGMSLEVSDNGCGFEPGRVDGGGMGLDNLRSRAAEIGARLEIQSGPGQGTQIKVILEEAV